MSENILKYPAGTILLCEEGEYSDFGYCGQLVTLCECDLRALAAEYTEKYKPKSDYDRPDACGFVAWLITTQKCAPLECQTVYLGSYGELKLA